MYKLMHNCTAPSTFCVYIHFEDCILFTLYMTWHVSYIHTFHVVHIFVFCKASWVYSRPHFQYPYLFLLAQAFTSQPVPPHCSEAHWSWVHLRWHLPSAVHDCGEICLNLQGTVLNGSHWSTFAWHCDWQSQSAYHGPGDGQTLIYRWDGVGWVWLIDRLSLSHWGITKPSLHSRRAILCWCMSVYYRERIDAFALVCMYGCVCECGWSALYRLPIAPWVWWQVKNRAVRLARPTSSKTGRMK